jgi:hypothetical protein
VARKQAGQVLTVFGAQMLQDFALVGRESFDEFAGAELSVLGDVTFPNHRPLSKVENQCFGVPNSHFRP